MFAYEELLEKYNVPRKGLPEAVSEAEDYRAKVRAHRGNKLVTSNSPAQAGVSPDSTTVSYNLGMAVPHVCIYMYIHIWHVSR